ncbi:MAG TPA: GNAT family N-acetyltransferase [Pseudonocardiaceae bacterium]|nr:GNAT family N-acetyltransferase [Pseudonocardiaceae bacterium]
MAARADFEPLTRSLGDTAYYTDWLRRQDAERGELLIAFLHDRPVGAIYLWLEDADEPEIRRHLPGVPLLRHLRVLRPRQRQRIGTTLITVAEARLRKLGRTQVAMAVDVTNVDAARLYDRLGYQLWDHGEISCSPLSTTNGNGSMDVCRVLVKTLD